MHWLRQSSRTVFLASCLIVAGLGLGLSGDAFTAATANAQAKPEKHPHIHAAIRELKEARKDLKEADHDFGGHRVQAIEDIDKAIVQLEKCLKHDKK
jgi:hypothetical protein